MEKRGLIFLTILFCLPLVSSLITVSQASYLYSFGDELVTNITIQPQKDTNEFLVATLVCDGQSKEVFRNPYNLLAGDRRIIGISVSLEKTFIPNGGGECTLDVTYGPETISSQRFYINNEVQVRFSLNGEIDPEKSVIINGEARKSNGKYLDNGEVIAEISDIGLRVIEKVDNGRFNFTFFVPKQAPAGSYDLKVSAYDRDSKQEISNFGESSTRVKIKQVPSGVDLAVNVLTFAPGDKLEYYVKVSDQSGQRMERDVKIILRSPNGNNYIDKVVNSKDSNSINITQFFTPGDWNIEVLSQEYTAVRNFYVQPYENISFWLDNETLSIKNLGNVYFNDVVSVEIGSKNVFDETVELEVGEVKKYTLRGDGTFEVVATVGKNSFSIGEASLTGRAISLSEFGKKENNTISFILWILAILVLAAIVYVFYRRTKKRHYFGRIPKRERDYLEIPRKVSSTPNAKFVEIKPIQMAKEGKREEVCIVALAIKNLDNLMQGESDIEGTLQRIGTYAKSSKARIKKEGNTFIFVYSPMVTGDEDNRMSALKLASRIASLINERNKRYALKVEYGVGIHTGEMIVENLGNKMKFVSVGNTIIGAKKACEKSNENVYLSSTFHKKAHMLVKDEALPAENHWRLLQVIDRSEHNEFIDKFMKKTKSEF
jgi:hypothetical protein